MAQKKDPCTICDEGFFKKHKGELVEEFIINEKPYKIKLNQVEWQECDSCDEKVLSTEIIKLFEIEKLRILGLLSPKEIKKIRLNLGLTQEQMARLLGIGKKTYFRWEKGLSIQSKVMNSFLKLLRHDPSIIPFLIDENDFPEDDFYERNKSIVKAYIDKVKNSIFPVQAEGYGIAAHRSSHAEEEYRQLLVRLREIVNA